MAKSALKLNRLADEESFFNILLSSSNSEVRHMSRVWLAYLYAMQNKLADAERIAFEALDGTRAQRAELLALVSYYSAIGDEKSAERIASLLQVKHADEYLAFDLECAMETTYDFPKTLAKSIAEIPESITLTNYPNPFNPATTISFHLPESEKVILKVYDIKGQLVATLVDNVLSEGFHSIDFNGRHLSSGIYIYEITAGKLSHVNRMLLLK